MFNVYGGTTKMPVNDFTGESPNRLGASSNSYSNSRQHYFSTSELNSQDNISFYQEHKVLLSQEIELEILVTIEALMQHFHCELPEHNHNVGNLSAKLAFRMGMSNHYVTLISQAARLHDLGKIGISKSILLKPDKLTAKEREQVSEHCQIGSDLLSEFDSELFNMAQSIAIAHHERWNGEGYPFHLTATTIPLEARIVAVADVFDALISERPYGNVWSIEEIIPLFIGKSGIHFDPVVVDALLEVLQNEASEASPS